MKKAIRFSAITLAFLTFTSCNQEKVETAEVDDTVTGLVEEVFTKEQQDALTPDQVIQSLTDGNNRFANNSLTARNHSEQVRRSTLSQYPKAIILSCIDSRVPVEDVFDKGIGDLFVARVAGNFVNEDILGSMEYACKVSGSKIVLVLGHEHCGAVKAAVDGVELGNITAMLQKIKPAIAYTTFEGDRSSKDQNFLVEVGISNVRNNMEEIRAKSPILKEMEDNGEIKIIGGIYDMIDGKVDWIE